MGRSSRSNQWKYLCVYTRTIRLLPAASTRTPGNYDAVRISQPRRRQAATTISGPTTCSPTLPIYAGTFDNGFYSGGAGNLYVCGNIGVALPTLFQVSCEFNRSSRHDGNHGPALAASGNVCGPVVEIYNPNATGGAKDWIFTSVEAGSVIVAPIRCPTPIRRIA